MKLSHALAKINGGTPAAEKTASATQPVSTAPSSSDAARDVLAIALKEATAPEPTATKTASDNSPVADLAKLAADVSSAEHEALVKEAQLYGASVCDGFIARLAQYQDAATKVAAQQGTVPVTSTKEAAAEDSFEKFAAANPDLVREAHDLGYEQTKTQLTKLAEASYVHGFNSTVESIYKLACDSFMKGFTDTAKILETGVR